MNVEILIRSELEAEIEELKTLAKKYGAEADQHQKNADELPDVRDVSIFWRNYYQQKECYCLQRLFEQQCKLKQLLAAT